MDKVDCYESLKLTLKSLTEDEDDVISLMATFSCELFHAFEHVNWAGFYRRVDHKTLKVGPYQGGHGCLVITLDRGVCGRCARESEVQVVPDVQALPYHIACSSETRAEIVLPLVDDSGYVTAVLDVDSIKPGAFDETDAKYLRDLLTLAGL